MGKKKAKAKNYFQAKKYCKSIIEVFLKMRKLKKNMLTLEIKICQTLIEKIKRI